MPNSTDDTNDQTNSDCRKRRNSSPPERSFSPDLSTSSSPSNGALQQQFEQALNAGMNNIPLGDLSHIAFNYMLVVANALHEHYRRRESLREMMLLEHLRRDLRAALTSLDHLRRMSDRPGAGRLQPTLDEYIEMNFRAYGGRNREDDRNNSSPIDKSCRSHGSCDGREKSQ